MTTVECLPTPVDDTEIIAIFVIIDDVLHRLGHRDHCLAQTADAEVLLVAVLAARYFSIITNGP